MDSDTLKKRTAKAVRFLFFYSRIRLSCLFQKHLITKTSPHPIKHLIAYPHREQTGILFHSIPLLVRCQIFVSLFSRSPLFFLLRENKTFFLNLSSIQSLSHWQYRSFRKENRRDSIFSPIPSIFKKSYFQSYSQ